MAHYRTVAATQWAELESDKELRANCRGSFEAMRTLSLGLGGRVRDQQRVAIYRRLAQISSSLSISRIPRLRKWSTAQSTKLGALTGSIDARNFIVSLSRM